MEAVLTPLRWSKICYRHHRKVIDTLPLPTFTSALFVRFAGGVFVKGIIALYKRLLHAFLQLPMTFLHFGALTMSTKYHDWSFMLAIGDARKLQI